MSNPANPPQALEEIPELAPGEEQPKPNVPDGREKLKTEVTLQKVKNVIVSGVEKCAQFFRGYKPFEIGVIDPDKPKAKVDPDAVIRFFAWFIAPKAMMELQKGGKGAEEALATMNKAADKVGAAYETYKKTGETKDVRTCFKEATANHESGAWEKNSKARLSLANMHAIIPEGDKKNTAGRALEKAGIKPTILTNSNDLFPEGVPPAYEQFEHDIATKLNTTSADAIQILSWCAIGKYQIIPQYHLKPCTGEAIYEFMQSETLQEKAMDRITNDLGGRYKWNTLHMAAAFYGGYKAGDKLRDVPQDESLKAEQQHGSSIFEYANKTVALMKKLMAKQS